MTDRPILFSAPMVRALLDGRKTQTRRIVTPANIRLFMGDGVGSKKPSPELLVAAFEWAQDFRRFDGVQIWRAKAFDYQAPAILTQWQAHATYGVPGDRLWVKETWAKCDDRGGYLRYYATDDVHELRRKRPSIHMPRWASRLWLTITDVRVEKLQAISEADAIAEGLIWRPAIEAWSSNESVNWPTFTDPVRSYAGLWNHINGPGSWDANPWVWAISFEAHQGNIGRAEAA